MATIPPPPAAAMAAAAISGRQAPPAIMTIFGAAGDLTKRLVVPALYNLVRAGKLSDEFAIIGVDIADLTTEGWRQSLTEMIDAFAGGGAGNFQEAIDEQAWSWLTRRMHYLRGDFAQPKTFSRLVMMLDEQREQLRRNCATPDCRFWTLPSLVGLRIKAILREFSRGRLV